MLLVALCGSTSAVNASGDQKTMNEERGIGAAGSRNLRLPPRAHDNTNDPQGAARDQNKRYMDTSTRLGADSQIDQPRSDVRTDLPVGPSSLVGPNSSPKRLLGPGSLMGSGGPAGSYSCCENLVDSAMQMMVQDSSRVSQTISNIMKSDADTRLNPIRNLRP